MTVTWQGRGHKDAGDSHMTGGCGTCWVWSRVTSEAAIFLAAFASICKVDTGLLSTDGKALYMSPQTVLHPFTGLTLLSTPSCVHLPRRPPLSAGPNPNPRRPPLSAGPNPNPHRPPAVTCSDTLYYSIAVHLLVLTCSDDVTQSSVLV